jgi:drug/metabolite transporter (DMT)-like permease
LKNLTVVLTALPYKIQAYRKNAAVYYLAAGAAMISFSGVWVKLAHVTPTIAGFYRVFFGGILVLIAALWKREITWRGWQHIMLGFLSGFFLALDLFFWHTSIQYIGPGLATLLGNFEVFLITAVGALFLGERIGLKFIFALVMAFTGLFLIVGLQWDQLGHQYKTGVYLGFATAVVYTGFLLSLRKLQSDQTGVSVFYGLMIVSFATGMILGLKAYFTADPFTIPDVQSWIALLALGVLSQAIGWILITNALPRVRASLAGLSLLLQPSLSFVWDVLLFGRETSVVNWMGVVIVLSAIYLGMTGNSDDR